MLGKLRYCWVVTRGRRRWWGWGSLRGRRGRGGWVGRQGWVGWWRWGWAGGGGCARVWRYCDWEEIGVVFYAEGRGVLIFLGFLEGGHQSLNEGVGLGEPGYGGDRQCRVPGGLVER